MDPGPPWTELWIFVILPIVIVVGFIGQIIDETFVKPRRRARRHAEYVAYKASRGEIVEE